MNMMTSVSAEAPSVPVGVNPDLATNAKPNRNMLSRMMKSWEKKQKKATYRAGTLGFVAVSLAACNSDSSTSGEDDDVFGDAPGDILGLTIEEDDVQGGDGDDIISGPLASGADSNTGAVLQTLQEFDVVDGGGGQNVLEAVLNGTGNMPGATAMSEGQFARPEIVNVQEYYLSSRDDAAGLDLRDAEGYEQLWFVDSDRNLQLDNVGENAVIGMRDVDGGTMYRVNFSESADTNAEDGVVVVADSVGVPEEDGNATVEVNAENDVARITVDASGDNGLDIQGQAAVTVEELRVTGAGELDLGGDFPSLTTLDTNFNTFTGDFIFDASASRELEYLRTGEGDDVVTVNSQAMDGNFEADMGDGDDVLVVVSSSVMGEGDPSFSLAALDGLDFGSVTNVETLSFEQGFYIPQGFDIPTEGIMLDLSGFDDDLATMTVPAIEPGGDFTVAGGSEVMAIDVADSVDLDGGVFAVDDVRDLDLVAGDDLSLAGGFASESVETLALNAQGDDASVLADLDGNLDSLASFEANAEGGADVQFDNGNGVEFEDLAQVHVATEAGEGALVMNGAESEIVGLEYELSAAETTLADQTDELSNQQDDRDDALIKANAREEDRGDADEILQDAQFYLDAANQVLATAQEDLDQAEEALSTAQSRVDLRMEPLDDFFASDLWISPGSGADDSADNRETLENYILGLDIMSADQKSALIDVIPDGIFRTDNNRDTYLEDAESALEEDYAISGLDESRDNAEAARDEAADDVNDAEVVRDNALADFENAEAAYDEALDAFEDAEAAVAATMANIAELEDDIVSLNDAIAEAGTDGVGFEDLETVTLSGGDEATADITDVYGAFDLEADADMVNVELENTNAESVTLMAGDDHEAGDMVDLDISAGDSSAGDSSAGDSGHGNPELEMVEMSGAYGDASLSGNLSSMEVIDLTGLHSFHVDVADAEFDQDIGESGYMSFRIGGSDGEDPDLPNMILSSADDRESFRFTEDDFTMTVIDNFDAGGGGDRLNLADLGVTQEGDLVFDTGDFDEREGDFTSGSDDLRIRDDAGNFEGDIILMDVSEDDLSGANFNFA